jgi:hypothetical protein
MGDAQHEPDGRYADGPVVGLTGARFGGSAGRRLRAADPDVDECRSVKTHRLIRDRPIVGQTGARFGSLSRRRDALSEKSDEAPHAASKEATEWETPAMDATEPVTTLPQAGPTQTAEPDAASAATEPGLSALATRPRSEPPRPEQSRAAEVARPHQPPAPEPDEDEDWDGPSTTYGLVRPYTWTKGRTASRQHLAVEALISATGMAPESIADPEHDAVLGLCATPRSVAELAALLAVPLGVARVLLGDMAEAGIVRVHRTASWEGAPDLALMQRVLSALHRL